MLAAASAHGGHVPGATYSGTAASGATVQLHVSPYGDTAGFTIQDSRCGIPFFEDIYFIVITDHAFSQTSPHGSSVAGSFPARQQAAGTLSYKWPSPPPACTGEAVSWTDVSWTATTPTLTECGDWVDNDGDGLIDYPADPDCRGPYGLALGPEQPPAVIFAVGTTSRSPRLGRRGAVPVTVSTPRVAVSPPPPATLTARGTVSVPGAARMFRLRPDSARLAGGATATLKPKLVRNGPRAARRALTRGKRVRAHITVTGAAAGLRTTTQKLTIRLRR
jgi:hypothetical protein